MLPFHTVKFFWGLVLAYNFIIAFRSVRINEKKVRKKKIKVPSQLTTK